MQLTYQALEVPLALQEPSPHVHFVWLELTGQCNLQCTHCYADSSPHGTHGSMQLSDWEAVLVDTKAAGAQTVQFIGGEPTLHPHFVELVRLAASLELSIEVFSNLLRVPVELWELFNECHVALATSFYSSRPDVHDQVTTRTGSQKRTLSNIEKAIAHSIPLRVGLIKVLPDQEEEETEQLLRSVGVQDINVDDVRGVGRGGVHECSSQQVDQLCGRCSSGTAMIDPDGWVYPCVFARWLRIGNVRMEPFHKIVASQAMNNIRADLTAAFTERSTAQSCVPNCGPSGCAPNCAPSVGCIPPPRPPSPCPPRR